MVRTVRNAVFVTTLALILATAGPALAATELVLWDWYDQRGALYQEMADKYREVRPDVHIKVEIVPWEEFWSKLALAASTGVGPDLNEFHNEQYAAFAGHLAPFPADLFPLDEMAENYIHFDQAFNYDGAFYFMPGGIMTGGIFYNHNILVQSGVEEVPRAWDDFLGLARKLTRIDADNNLIQAGFSANDMGLMLDLLYQNGGYLYGPNGVTWGEAPGIRAVNQLADIMLSGISETPTRTLTGSFEGGNAAMAYRWTHIGGYLNTLDLEWGVTVLPTETGDSLPARGRNNYESGLAVMASVPPEKQRLAFEFIKWIHEDDEFLVRLNTLIGRIPAKVSVWSHPELLDNPIMRMLMEQAPYTVFAGPIPGWTWEVLYVTWEDIVTGRVAPETALAESVLIGNAHFAEDPPLYNVEREYRPSTEG